MISGKIQGYKRKATTKLTIFENETQTMNETFQKDCLVNKYFVYVTVSGRENVL